MCVRPAWRLKFIGVYRLSLVCLRDHQRRTRLRPTMPRAPSRLAHQRRHADRCAATDSCQLASRTLSSRCLWLVRVSKKGWTLARLLRGGQHATRVQPKPGDLLHKGGHLSGLFTAVLFLFDGTTPVSVTSLVPHSSTMTSNPP